MSAQTTITFGACSDVGMVRQDNQDCYGKFPEGDLDVSAPKGQLFIVADGMGGHVGGREASEMAVNTIHESYFKDDVGPVPAGLRHAFEEANARIYDFSTTHPRYANMGTTCSALAIKDDRGYINHIGDSRIYRVTQSSIEQLTNDHSRVAELQRRGLITKEEARYHPERSHLYRALGVRSTAEVDAIDDIHLDGNEYFVLCSDGLVNHVDDREIKDTVLQYEPQEACKRLVALANDRGGTDNVTVLVVKVSTTNSGS